MKKKAAALCSIFLVLCLAFLPMTALAGVKVTDGGLEQLPGNPQSSTPAYSKAWLDNVVIRDGTTSITACKPIPKPEYPFSRTYDEFVEDVAQYSVLHDLNENTMSEAYGELLQVFYYIVTALGMTDKTPVMKAYLEDYGITVPTNPTVEDKMKIATVYAVLKYNAVYVLYNKEITIPKGTTLEGAEVALISELMGVYLPSGINTVNGFAVEMAKQNVESFPDIPLSENPTNAEVFHWSKVLTAAANNYEVPMTPYPEASAAQRDYVDYAYYASIFNKIYDIQINPAKLAVAAESPDELAVQKVILMTMLDEKEIPYAPEASGETLFALACDAGYFELEPEFYSDVFDYDVFVDMKCTQIWFTPFSLASQLGGDDQYLTLYLDGKAMKPAGTTYVDLDPSRVGQEVLLVSRYDDGQNPVEQMVYRFYVVRTDEVSDSNLADDFQTMLDSVVPQENEQVQQVIEEVINYADNQVSADIFHPEIIPDAMVGEAVLTTFGSENDSQTISDNTEVDFDYLGRLIEETYPENETSVTAPLPETTTAPEEAPSLIVRTGQAIKEHPQLVAAPTGILALGGLLGYFWNRKRKDPTSPLDGDENI